MRKKKKKNSYTNEMLYKPNLYFHFLSHYNGFGINSHINLFLLQIFFCFVYSQNSIFHIFSFFYTYPYIFIST